jgi:hypothetical protein
MGVFLDVDWKITNKISPWLQAHDMLSSNLSTCNNNYAAKPGALLTTMEQLEHHNWQQ